MCTDRTQKLSPALRVYNGSNTEELAEASCVLAQTEIALQHKMQDYIPEPDSSGKTEAEMYFEEAAAQSEKITRDKVLETHQSIQNYPNLRPWKTVEIKAISRIVLKEIRPSYNQRYGFPVITKDFIKWINRNLGKGPFVEVGAGNAYFSYELIKRGFQVVATDPYEIKQNRYDIGEKTYTAMEIMGGIQAVQKYRSYDLIWSWPTTEPHTHETLEAFEGKHLLYIGDKSNGCTGSHRFHEILQEEFNLIDTYNLPNFPTVNDNAYIFRRRGS